MEAMAWIYTETINGGMTAHTRGACITGVCGYTEAWIYTEAIYGMDISAPSRVMVHYRLLLI